MSEPISVYNIDDKDEFLQILVNIANMSGMEFGITLNVGGYLVSGLLVSGRKYFEGAGAEFMSALPSAGLVEPFQKLFARYADRYPVIGEKQAETHESEPAKPQENEEEDKPTLLPGYIHLSNTRFFSTSGNPLPGNKGVWWRGRLSAVEGFMIGSLSVDRR